MKLQLVNIVSLAALPLLTTAKLLPDGKLIKGVVGVVQPRQAHPRALTSPAKRSPQDFNYNTYFDSMMAAANTSDEDWCGSTTHLPCPPTLEFCCPPMTYCVHVNPQFQIMEPRCIQCPNPGPETDVCGDGMTCCPAGKCSPTTGKCTVDVEPSNPTSSGGSSSSSDEDDEVGTEDEVVDDDVSVGNGDDAATDAKGADAKGADTKGSAAKGTDDGEETDADATNAAGTDAKGTDSKGAGTTKADDVKKDDEDAESSAVREAGRAGWQVAAVVGIMGYNVLA